MERAEFERLVVEALDGIPDEFARYLENVTVVIEDEPSAELLRSLGLDPGRETLYGLYQGTPLPGRRYDHVGLPDHVAIFAGPLMRQYPTAGDLRRQVRRTVVRAPRPALGILKIDFHRDGRHGGRFDARARLGRPYGLPLPAVGIARRLGRKRRFAGRRRARRL